MPGRPLATQRLSTCCKRRRPIPSPNTQPALGRHHAFLSGRADQMEVSTGAQLLREFRFRAASGVRQAWWEVRGQTSSRLALEKNMKAESPLLGALGSFFAFFVSFFAAGAALFFSGFGLSAFGLAAALVAFFLVSCTSELAVTSLLQRRHDAGKQRRAQSSKGSPQGLTWW